jgi:uncharacterized protein (UPF0212 family)
MSNTEQRVAELRAEWIAACDANEMAQDQGHTDDQMAAIYDQVIEAYNRYEAAQDELSVERGEVICPSCGRYSDRHTQMCQFRSANR